MWFQSLWQKKKEVLFHTGFCSFTWPKHLSPLEFSSDSYRLSSLLAGQTFLAWLRPASICSLVYLSHPTFTGRISTCETASQNSYIISTYFHGKGYIFLSHLVHTAHFYGLKKRSYSVHPSLNGIINSPFCSFKSRTSNQNNSPFLICQS